jgi:hypothetical protein
MSIKEKWITFKTKRKEIKECENYLHNKKWYEGKDNRMYQGSENYANHLSNSFYGRMGTRPTAYGISKEEYNRRLKVGLIKKSPLDNCPETIYKKYKKIM